MISKVVSGFCTNDYILNVLSILLDSIENPIETCELRKYIREIYTWYKNNIDFILETPYVLNKDSHKSVYSLIEEIDSMLVMEGCHE